MPSPGAARPGPPTRSARGTPARGLPGQRLCKRQDGIQARGLLRDGEDRPLGRRRLGGSDAGVFRQQVERGVLTENRTLQILQRLGRLDTELVHENAARLLVGAERLGLPSGAIESEYELPAEPLAQRMLGDERLELGNERCALAERKVGLDPVF